MISLGIDINTEFNPEPFIMLGDYDRNDFTFEGKDHEITGDWNFTGEVNMEDVIIDNLSINNIGNINSSGQINATEFCIFGIGCFSNLDISNWVNDVGYLTAETDPTIDTLTSEKLCFSPDGLEIDCTIDQYDRSDQFLNQSSNVSFQQVNATTELCINGDCISGWNAVNISGINPFDQSLNTTDAVNFVNVTITDNLILTSGQEVFTERTLNTNWTWTGGYVGDNRENVFDGNLGSVCGIFHDFDVNSTFRYNITSNMTGANLRLIYTTFDADTPTLKIFCEGTSSVEFMYNSSDNFIASTTFDVNISTPTECLTGRNNITYHMNTSNGANFQQITVAEENLYPLIGGATICNNDTQKLATTNDGIVVCEDYHNITADLFKGSYDWVIDPNSSMWLQFDQTNLSFNNITLDDYINNLTANFSEVNNSIWTRNGTIIVAANSSDKVKLRNNLELEYDNPKIEFHDGGFNEFHFRCTSDCQSLNVYYDLAGGTTFMSLNGASSTLSMGSNTNGIVLPTESTKLHFSGTSGNEKIIYINHAPGDLTDDELQVQGDNVIMEGTDSVVAEAVNLVNISAMTEFGEVEINTGAEGQLDVNVPIAWYSGSVDVNSELEANQVNAVSTLCITDDCIDAWSDVNLSLDDYIKNDTDGNYKVNSGYYYTGDNMMIFNNTNVTGSNSIGKNQFYSKYEAATTSASSKGNYFEAINDLSSQTGSTTTYNDGNYFYSNYQMQPSGFGAFYHSGNKFESIIEGNYAGGFGGVWTGDFTAIDFIANVTGDFETSAGFNSRGVRFTVTQEADTLPSTQMFAISSDVTYSSPESMNQLYGWYHTLKLTGTGTISGNSNSFVATLETDSTNTLGNDASCYRAYVDHNYDENFESALASGKKLSAFEVTQSNDFGMATHNFYSFYTNINNSKNNYAFVSDEADSWFKADNTKLMFGPNKELNISYDGTNAHFDVSNPIKIGSGLNLTSGNFYLNGNLGNDTHRYEWHELNHTLNQSYDQSLNKTDNVTFYNLNSTGNISTEKIIYQDGIHSTAIELDKYQLNLSSRFVTYYTLDDNNAKNIFNPEQFNSIDFVIKTNALSDAFYIDSGTDEVRFGSMDDCNFLSTDSDGSLECDTNNYIMNDTDNNYDVIVNNATVNNLITGENQGYELCVDTNNQLCKCGSCA